ncbi:DotG/IcmE/VirB10 family type IV secretion system protein [Acidisoma sp. 7E03]
MSDAARPSWRPKLPHLKGTTFLTGAGRAGPRRLLVIGAGGLVLVVLIVAVVTSGHHAKPFSQDARMKQVDALPGGLHSTPEQDALAKLADTQEAQRALASGASYTPPLAPSAVVVAQPSEEAPPDAPAAPPPTPRFVPHPAPTPVVAVDDPVFPPQTIGTPGTASTPAPTPMPAQTVTLTANPQAVAAYSKEIGDLFSQWGGRAPQTDVVMPPPSNQDGADPAGAQAGGAATQAADPAPTARSIATAAQTAPTVLIPAGRGIYAHPILALSSDQTSPVIMQADSGPIAGDRMIGSFERQDDRLVIHINSIVHQGQTLGCDAVVVAPNTMEASVATGVDEHYVSRIILPAAAAFVQGLGQALATTSNSTAVLSPFGGATTSTNLNFQQQLGVAAGAAAGQIGSVLNQEAPKGPTVTLDANVGVGVMFLSDVKLPANQ